NYPLIFPVTDRLNVLIGLTGKKFFIRSRHGLPRRDALFAQFYFTFRKVFALAAYRTPRPYHFGNGVVGCPAKGELHYIGKRTALWIYFLQNAAGFSSSPLYSFCFLRHARRLTVRPAESNCASQTVEARR